MELQAVCWGGSFAVELVAAFAWNGWQASSGISGNLGLEYAACHLTLSTGVSPVRLYVYPILTRSKFSRITLGFISEHLRNMSYPLATASVA